MSAGPGDAAPATSAHAPRGDSHTSYYTHPESGHPFSLINLNVLNFRSNRCYVILLYEYL